MCGLDKIINRHMRFQMPDVANDDVDDVEIFADGMTRSQWIVMQPEYVELTRKMMEVICENDGKGHDLMG